MKKSIKTAFSFSLVCLALVGCASTGTTTAGNQTTPTSSVPKGVKVAQENANTARDTAHAVSSTTWAIRDAMNNVRSIFGK